MDQRERNAMLTMDDGHWWYRGRRRIIRAELDKLALPAGARVLDAGCGSGRTLQELLRYDGELYGIEFDPDAAEIARERSVAEIRIGRIEELPWEDGFFDLITCLDVIEHTPDDRSALRELRRACKPGGHLLMTVPAYRALWSLHDIVNHHYRRYERRTLRPVAVETGWRVCRMTSFNSLLLAPAAAVRLTQRRRLRESDPEFTSELHLGPTWINSMLERPLQLEANWIGRGRTLPAGLSLLALLENPEHSA
jgi:SAM-dependent methyltransferase